MNTSINNKELNKGKEENTMKNTIIKNLPRKVRLSLAKKEIKTYRNIKDLSPEDIMNDVMCILGEYNLYHNDCDKKNDELLWNMLKYANKD